MNSIRIRHVDDKLIGRDVLIVAFFARQPYPELVPQVAETLELFRSIVPPDSLEWARVGPNSSQYVPLSPAVLKRGRAELDIAKLSGRDIGSLRLRGGDDPHNAAYGFTFLGGQPYHRAPTLTSLVELRFPSEFLEQLGLEKFVDMVRRIGETLPFRSGYASPALSRGWENEKHVQEAGRQLVPIALRHPAYDLPENESTAAFMGETQCRGARWLTLIGPQIVSTLGGREQLLPRLSPGVTTVSAGEGLMIRAGERPELGDVNRDETVPLLRSVAAALEPVTYFDDWKSLGTLFGDDHDRVRAWERRLLD